MIEKFARATQRLLGLLLGGIAIGTQVSNILICIALLICGASALIHFLSPRG